MDSEKKWKWQEKWPGKPTLEDFDVVGLSADIKDKLLKFQDAYTRFLSEHSSTYRSEVHGPMYSARVALERIPEFKPFLLNPNDFIECLSTDDGPDAKAESAALEDEYKRREYEVYKLSLRIEDRRPSEVREGRHLN